MSCHDAELGKNPAIECMHYLSPYLPPLNTSNCISKDSRTSMTNTLFNSSEHATKDPLSEHVNSSSCQ